MSRLKFSLPETLTAEVQANVADWRSTRKIQRLWRRDATLWTADDEGKWLGWLDIAEYEIAHPIQLRGLAKEIWSAGFKDAMLLGMGGSSLCPEVLRKTFGQISGYPTLHVLDSTDPAQVKSFEEKVDIARTLFIVSSKSGTTLEPNIFKQYFFERVKQLVGADAAGSRFIAITDPGSQLHKAAEEDHFRLVYFGRPSIGGRNSALSNFGMIPAAIIGIDTKKFLDRAQEMVRACGPEPEMQDNPGAMLGVILGTAAKNGRDKVTLITSPDISDLGAWLEQLLAESTGKNGKGIIPVDREELGAPDVYGSDRVFAYIHTEHATSVGIEQKIAALEKAGHPVIRISMADVYDTGAEFFRWEIATAVAGSIIGINAFNQPDVEASKVETRKLTSEYEKTGSLPAESPMFEEDGIKLFTDDTNAAALKLRAGERSLAGYLKAHLDRLRSGDYFAALAYLQMNAEHEKDLQQMRHAVRDRKRVATCLGFGPRFLHSTGQAYKGGPNSGVFLQVTCDDAIRLPVPGQKYTFGVVKAAQARGDFQVLVDRGRRALRVHLPSDVRSGLAKLNTAIGYALQ